MQHFSGYGAYVLFLSLRTHFNSAKYDFFQFNGKLRTNKESYLKRHDKYFFERIAKDYKPSELRDFFIANLLEDKHYITDMLDDDAKRNFNEYKRRRQALTYNVTSELEKLLDSDPSRAFKFDDSQYPNIITLYLRHVVSPETMVILNDFVPYESKFNKYMSDDVLWVRISLKLRKYKPFVQYDKYQVKNIIKGILDKNL